MMEKKDSDPKSKNLTLHLFFSGFSYFFCLSWTILSFFNLVFFVRSTITHFNDDPELPVYSQRPGYSLSELVEILMSGTLPEDKVCQIQPLCDVGVTCMQLQMMWILEIKWYSLLIHVVLHIKYEKQT